MRFCSISTSFFASWCLLGLPYYHVVVEAGKLRSMASDGDDFHGGMDFFFDKEDNPLLRTGKVTVVRDAIDDTCVFSLDFNSAGDDIYTVSFLCEAAKMGMNGRLCGIRYAHNMGDQVDDDERLKLYLFGCEKENGGLLESPAEDLVPEVTLSPPNVAKNEEKLFEVFAATRVASHVVQFAIVAGGEGVDASIPTAGILNALALWIKRAADTLGVDKNAWRKGGDFSADIEKANANYKSIQDKPDDRRALATNNMNSFQKDVVDPANTAAEESRQGRRLKDDGITISNPTSKCNNGCFGRCGDGCNCWDWVCGDCSAFRGCWEHDCYCSCHGLWQARCVSFMANPGTCSVPSCAAWYCGKSNVIDSCNAWDVRRLVEQQDANNIKEEEDVEEQTSTGLPYHLTNYEEMILSDEQWQDYQAKCSKYHYEWKIYIDKHMYMMMKPTTSTSTTTTEIVAEDKSCGALVMHADVPKDDRFGHFIKRVVTPEVSEEAMALFHQRWEEGLFSHVFLFEEIARAYNAAHVNPSGTEKPHDIVLNNCGDLVVEVAKPLGITLDQAVITQALLHQGGDLLIADILDSEISLLKDNEQDIDDETLVMRLVQTRLA